MARKPYIIQRWFSGLFMSKNRNQRTKEKWNVKRITLFGALLVAAFFGWISVYQDHVLHTEDEKLTWYGTPPSLEEQLSQSGEKIQIETSGKRVIIRQNQENQWNQGIFSEECGSWGLGGYQDGSEKQPTGSLNKEQMKEMEAYYVGADTKKVIYLTFDCGYENGNTELILDALKKHNAPATFFVVGHFLETSPELIKRMVSDGHTVGNHTYHHKDMSELADPATFTKEMQEVENLYQEITGTKMCPYYRPPQGKYDTKNLQTAKDMGYHTFFWSLAYVDWKADAQPSEQEALAKLTARIHPGAIVLLHNTSSTNGKIMDKLLTEWEKMGYSFGKLEDLCRS